MFLLIKKLAAFWPHLIPNLSETELKFKIHTLLVLDTISAKTFPRVFYVACGFEVYTGIDIGTCSVYWYNIACTVGFHINFLSPSICGSQNCLTILVISL